MSYAELLEEEVKQSQYLAVLKPRRRLSAFTLFSGSVYRQALTYTQYVLAVTVAGVELTRVSTTALSAGQFYFDSDNQFLYVRMSDSTNPNTKFVVLTFELYFGTLDAHFHRDPLDSNTTEVYFEPTITSPPDAKAQVSDLIFGYLPVQSSSISLGNAEHSLDELLYDSSFNQCEISVYHWLSRNGELEIANIKKVLNGICGKVTYQTSTVQIEIRDRVDLLTKEWRNPVDSFYSTALFPNVNPNSIGRPIRYVYGKVQGVAPVNVTYFPDEPTTSDNRSHAVIPQVTGISEKVFTVAVSPVSTTTRTYLTSVKGIDVGDTAFLDGATDYYVEVTGVNRGANPYIEHAANAAPMAAGESVRKGFVSRIDILQSQQRFTALYGRDYTCSANLLGSGVAGFVFSASLESNLLMPNTLSPSDTIYCTVYGETNTVTLGGVAFGADDSELGVLTDPVVILFQILKTKLGLSESDLNLTSFQALLALIGGSSVGISIPFHVTDNFLTIKDIIISLMQTMLTSIYVDNDLKWKVSREAPIVSVDAEITSEEMAPQNTFQVSYDYDDTLSDVIVEYNARELGETFTASELSDKVTAESDVAKYLHKIQKQKTFPSLHIKAVEAQGLCDNLALIFGDRNSRYSVNTVSKFYGLLLANRVRVTRDRLPGFTFQEGVENSRDLVVTSIKKDLSKVSLELTDQKGIEENEGVWAE